MNEMNGSPTPRPNVRGIAPLDAVEPETMQVDIESEAPSVRCTTATNPVSARLTR